MENNIFMISDASFMEDKNLAGVGVVDLNTNQKYSKIYQKVKNSYFAEFYALVYSVQIALKNNYENVVFIYDNQSLDITNLKLYVKDKFKSVQFLWLKREYVDQADKLASKALQLAKELNIKPIPYKKVMKKQKIIPDDRVLINIFCSCKDIQILNASLKFAKKREKNVIQGYILKKTIKLKENGKLIGVGSKKRTFMRFVYHSLSTNLKNDFYNYLCTIDPHIKKSKFKTKIPINTQVDYIKKILLNLKKAGRKK